MAPNSRAIDRLGAEIFALRKRVLRLERRLAPMSLDTLPAPISAVVQRLADCHGFTVGDVAGRGRTPRECTARAIVYAELVDMGMKPGAIANVFGRDRTTILHALQQHEARKEQTPPG